MSYSRRRLLAQVFGFGVFGALLGPTTGARAGTMSYEYDAFGRLKNVTYPDSSVVSYSYDAAGNRVQKGPPGSGFSATVQVIGSGPVDLRTLANSNGYTGADATIIFEVGSGVTIIGDPGSAGVPSGDGGAGGAAISTGDWPGGYTIALTLRVKSGGSVIGGGGGGGGGAGEAGGYYNGGYGGGGGTAVSCSAPLTVEVQSGGSIIGGASGGGGGYNGYEVLSDSYTFDYAWAGGGGGGGGFPNGYGGIGCTNGPESYSNPVDPGINGSDGTTGGGGSGGAGGYVSTPYGSGSGDSGGNGSSSTSGFAIAKNGQTVSVSNSGTITGAVA